MAFEIRANTANVFTPREKGEFEFIGDGDIDGEKYKVSVKEAYSGTSARGAYTSRKLKFEGVGDNTLVFEGAVFDRRVDNRPLNEKAPVWTGNISCKINHELTVNKEVSIWEKRDKNKNLYLSMGIRDKGERSAPRAAQTEVSEPAF